MKAERIGIIRRYNTIVSFWPLVGGLLAMLLTLFGILALNHIPFSILLEPMCSATVILLESESFTRLINICVSFGLVAFGAVSYKVSKERFTLDLALLNGIHAILAAICLISNTFHVPHIYTLASQLSLLPFGLIVIEIVRRLLFPWELSLSKNGRKYATTFIVLLIASFCGFLIQPVMPIDTMSNFFWICVPVLFGVLTFKESKRQLMIHDITLALGLLLSESLYPYIQAETWTLLQIGISPIGWILLYLLSNWLNSSEFSRCKTSGIISARDFFYLLEAGCVLVILGVSSVISVFMTENRQKKQMFSPRDSRMPFKIDGRSSRSISLSRSGLPPKSPVRQSSGYPLHRRFSSTSTSTDGENSPVPTPVSKRVLSSSRVSYSLSGPLVPSVERKRMYSENTADEIYHIDLDGRRERIDSSPAKLGKRSTFLRDVKSEVTIDTSGIAKESPKPTHSVPNLRDISVPERSVSPTIPDSGSKKGTEKAGTEKSISSSDLTESKVRFSEIQGEELEKSSGVLTGFEEDGVLLTVLIGYAEKGEEFAAKIVDLGHDAVIVRSGDELVAAYAATSPDLILLCEEEGDKLFEPIVTRIRDLEEERGVEGDYEAPIICLYGGPSIEAEDSQDFTNFLQREGSLLNSGANDFITVQTLDMVLPHVLEQLSTMKVTNTSVNEDFQDNETLTMANELYAQNSTLTGLLERFIPPYFHEIVPSGSGWEGLKLGEATEKVATVFFSDIRRFTTLTEKLTSAEAMQFLNTYFAFSFPAITSSGGFIEKTIGDSIMAIFLGENQAANAVRASVNCQIAWDFMNESGFKTGAIDTGIGLNTGRTHMGIVGTESRTELTVIGDTINLGARTEALCKTYGARLLITGNVHKALGSAVSEFKIRKVDHLTVRGRVKPTVVYEVYEADKPDVRAAKDKIKPDYDKGLVFFERGRFQEALSCFRRCKAKYDADIPTSHFIARCRQLIDRPPKVWDGVCHFQEKAVMVFEGVEEEKEEDAAMRHPSTKAAPKPLTSLPKTMQSSWDGGNTDVHSEGVVTQSEERASVSISRVNTRRSLRQSFIHPSFDEGRSKSRDNVLRKSFASRFEDSTHKPESIPESEEIDE